jgi:hypothetical protein
MPTPLTAGATDRLTMHHSTHPPPQELAKLHEAYQKLKRKWNAATHNAIYAEGVRNVCSLIDLCLTGEATHAPLGMNTIQPPIMPST